MEKKKPIHEIRLGRVRAAIWENEGDGDRVHYGVTFSRLYKDGDQWRGVREGWIPIVASDHSPHDPALKEPGWRNIFYNDEGTPIPFGAPSAETIVPLLYGKGVVEGGLPVWWLARVMAENLRPQHFTPINRHMLKLAGAGNEGRRSRAID